MKKISEETRAAVTAQYASGVPVRQIAASTGLGQATVMGIVRSSGVPLRGGCSHDAAKREEVRRLYESGVPVADILRQTGVKSRQTLYRFLDGATRRRRVPDA